MPRPWGRERLLQREAGGRVAAARVQALGRVGQQRAQRRAIAAHAEEHRHDLVGVQAVQPLVRAAPPRERGDAQARGRRQRGAHVVHEAAIERALRRVRLQVELHPARGRVTRRAHDGVDHDGLVRVDVDRWLHDAHLDMHHRRHAHARRQAAWRVPGAHEHLAAAEQDLPRDGRDLGGQRLGHARAVPDPRDAAGWQRRGARRCSGDEQEGGDQRAHRRIVGRRRRPFTDRGQNASGRPPSCRP